MRSALALLLVACGGASTRLPARHAIVEGPSNTLGFYDSPKGIVVDTDDRPTIAPCESWCARVMASDEKLESCQLAHGDADFSHRFASDNFFVCKLTKR